MSTQESSAAEPLSQEGSSNNVVILKIIFKVPSINATGIIFLQAGRLSRKVVQIQCAIVSSASEKLRLTLESPWTDYFSGIAQIKFSGNYRHKLSKDVEDALKRILTSDAYDNSSDIAQVIEGAVKSRYDNVVEILEPELKRILYDNKTEINVNSELISQKDLDKGMNPLSEKSEKEETAQSPPDPQSSDFFSYPDAEAVIPSNLVLGPVKGVPVYELKPGDEILIKFDNNTKEGALYNKKFNLIDAQGKITPVPAKILKFSKDSDVYRFVLHYKDRFYAKITEEEQIKVKLYDPVLVEQYFKSKDDEDDLIPKTTLILFIAFAGILLVLLSMIFL